MGTALTRLEFFRLFSLGRLANLYELEKAIRQKWNEIDNQKYKESVYQQSQNRMGTS